MSNKRLQMTITFGEFDDEIYDFLQEQKNASGLIRYLVNCYKNNIPIKSYNGNTQTNTNQNDINKKNPVKKSPKSTKKVVIKKEVEPIRETTSANTNNKMLEQEREDILNKGLEKENKRREETRKELREFVESTGENQDNLDALASLDL